MATALQQAVKENELKKMPAYQVGGSHVIDNSKYAGGTDANAVALNTLDSTLGNYRSALQAAYDSQAAQVDQQARKLRQQYDATRSNIYTNARLSAIGNNERLAALGLAGNLYDHARSGTSETSRIAQDVAMRRSLADTRQSENNAQSDLQLALLAAQKEADAKYAEYVAQNEQSKIPYLMALAQAQSMGGGGGGGGGGGYSTKKKSSGKSSSTSSEPKTDQSAKNIYDSSMGAYYNAKEDKIVNQLADKDARDLYYASHGYDNYSGKYAYSAGGKAKGYSSGR